MLKFIKHYMTSISDVDIWPTISLMIFVFFFTGMLISALRLKKSYTQEMSSIPLTDGTEDELDQELNNWKS